MRWDKIIINKSFNDLNPLLVGWEKCDSNHSYGPSVRTYWIVHYVVSGSGKLYTGKKCYDVKKGQIFIIKPDEITTYTADTDTPWHYIWIAFDGNLAQKMNKIKKRVIDYPETTFLDILKCADKNTTAEEFVASKLFEMYSVLFDKNEKNTNYEKMAYDYICANYMNDIKIDEVAKLAGVNRNYLSRRFKKAYGITMQQLLVNTRLAHSIELLKQGISVARASALVGYDDAFNYSKMFKKNYGVSPNNYIKEKPVQ